MPAPLQLPGSAALGAGQPDTSPRRSSGSPAPSPLCRSSRPTWCGVAGRRGRHGPGGVGSPGGGAGDGGSGEGVGS